MNYIVDFEKPEYFRVGGIEGEINSCIFYGDKQTGIHTLAESVDEVIELMSEHYPDIKNYQIRETLLSLDDIEENDKIRTEQNC